MSDVLAPIEVFCSYADEDESYLRELKAHLSGLERQGYISVWYDRQILAGKARGREINEHLEAASIVLLLISPDFLTSDYCYGVEMQRALERHGYSEAQVIPILVRPVDWEGAPFAHLQYLPRDGRAVTEWENRDAALRDVARDIRAVVKRRSLISPLPQPSRGNSRTLATTSIRAHDDGAIDRNRQRMLKRVHATWIAGVLDQSLHGAALIALGLEEKTDVLDNPWRLMVQEVDRPVQALPEGTRIVEVYDETEGGLLILGEPGAGKTTMLLELARDLLERAQSNKDDPIPVIFNLSSWAKKRLSLSDWLVEELDIRYEVPRRLGRSWVSEDRLLLLLDGLDEVEAAARGECIGAINGYRKDHPEVQVVVCSRRTEYLNEPTQLRLRTAVVIQPLTQVQIESYLESVGEQAEALREAIGEDEDLRELATTPLMLTILLFAYKGTPPEKISELTSLEAKRERIFATYVEHMLKRRGASKRYKPKQITQWLTSLAQQMKRQSQTVFYIEQIQPDWLLKRRQHYMYRALAGVVSGGLIGLLAGVILAGVIISTSSIGTITFFSVTGLIIGLNLGLIIGLFYLKSTEIRTAEVMAWSWANVRLTAIASIIGGSLGWVILFHSIGFFYSFLYKLPLFLFYPYYIYITLFFELFFLSFSGYICFTLLSLLTRRNPGEHRLSISRQRIGSAMRRGALVGICMSCVGLALVTFTGSWAYSLIGDRDIRYDIYLVALGCVSGLVTGLVLGVSSRQLETHKSFKPNQGIWRSLYNGGRVLLILGFIAWLVYDLPIIVNYELALRRGYTINFPSALLLTGILLALSVGFLFGLLNGGIACIKHVMLRIFLRRARALPWKCAHFLDYAAERILLRKVGGGYIFVHRLLLEHFAASVTPVPEVVSSVATKSGSLPAISSTAQSNTAQREEKASAPVPNRKAGFNKEKRIAALFVVVLLILETTIGASIFSGVQQSAQRAYATTQAHDATAQAATATAQAEANANAEATANASPIVYPPTNTSPVLDDPLEDNSKGNKWEVDNPKEGNCKFINQAYDINTNLLEWCRAMSTDFTNFIYEIQMKIVKGDEGGIAFRIDPTSGGDYKFAINQDGSYRAYEDDATLTQGSSSAIHRGLNQTNLVAAVVHDKVIELYVNHQRVAVVGSDTYSRGEIGVIVKDQGSNGTEVIFQNAKVWKL